MNTVTRSPLLPPSFATERTRPVDYLFRAGVCHLKAGGRDITKVVKQLYSNDAVTPLLVQRAASAPATVADPAWAGVVAHQVVSDLLQAIVSISAGAALLSAAQQINFGHAQTILLPSRLTDAAYAGTWLAEGQAIPVYQFDTSAVALTPHRLAVITTFTNEMLASSNIEEFVRSMLSEAAALAIDMALFGSQSDNGIVPPGILHGLTPITASVVGTTSRRDCIVEDFQNLVQKLADNGGGAGAAFVCAPAQALAAKINVGPEFDYAILASAALPTGTVICVEPRSLVATINAAVPEFSTAPSAVLMMNDSNPTDVVAGAPTRSMFQLDSLALKMTLQGIDWKLRAPHCAFVTGVNW